MMRLVYALAVSAMGVGLVVFSYLDRIYRELGRVNKGRVRQHLEIFESEIEPHVRCRPSVMVERSWPSSVMSR